MHAFLIKYTNRIIKLQIKYEFHIFNRLAIDNHTLPISHTLAEDQISCFKILFTQQMPYRKARFESHIKYDPRENFQELGPHDLVNPTRVTYMV